MGRPRRDPNGAQRAFPSPRPVLRRNGSASLWRRRRAARSRAVTRVGGFGRGCYARWSSSTCVSAGGRSQEEFTPSAQSKALARSLGAIANACEKAGGGADDRPHERQATPVPLLPRAAGDQTIITERTEPALGSVRGPALLSSCGVDTMRADRSHRRPFPLAHRIDDSWLVLVNRHRHLCRGRLPHRLTRPSAPPSAFPLPPNAVAPRAPGRPAGAARRSSARWWAPARSALPPTIGDDRELTAAMLSKNVSARTPFLCSPLSSSGVSGFDMLGGHCSRSMSSSISSRRSCEGRPSRELVPFRVPDHTLLPR